MLLDVEAIKLTPGNNGKDCSGNGEHFYKDGRIIECCCDECDYMKCCYVMKGFSNCNTCNDFLCPRRKDNNV